MSADELQHFLIKRSHSKSFLASSIHFTDARGLAFFPDIESIVDQPPAYVYFTVNMHRVSVRPYSHSSHHSYYLPIFHFYDNIIYRYSSESQEYRRTSDIVQEGQASNIGLPQLSTASWNMTTASEVTEISPADLNDYLSSQQISYVVRYFDHESRCRIKKPFLETLPPYVLLYNQDFGDEDVYNFNGEKCDLDNPHPILYKWNEKINRYQLIRKIRAYPTHVLYYAILVYGAHRKHQNTVIDYLKNDESVFIDPNKKTAAEQYTLVTDAQQTPESKADYYAQAKTDSARSPDALSADDMAKYITNLSADSECHIDYFHSDGLYNHQVEGEAFFHAPYILIRETRYIPNTEWKSTNEVSLDIVRHDLYEWNEDKKSYHIIAALKDYPSPILYHLTSWHHGIDTQLSYYVLDRLIKEWGITISSCRTSSRPRLGHEVMRR